MASPAKSKMGLFGGGNAKKQKPKSGGKAAPVEKSGSNPPKKRGRPRKNPSGSDSSRKDDSVPEKKTVAVSRPGGGLVLGLIDQVLKKGK